MVKIKIYRAHQLDETGVTPVWEWDCSYRSCWVGQSGPQQVLFWENAVRSANHHIAWHEQFYKVN